MALLETDAMRQTCRHSSLPAVTADLHPTRTAFEGIRVNATSASVIFVASHYYLHGDFSLGTSRVLEVLNDPTTRYLKLENVRILEDASDEPFCQLGATVLVKENIHLAMLVAEDRPSDNKVFFATRERKTFHCVVSLPSMLVEGRLHTKMATEPQSFLSLEAGAFFPITGASLRQLGTARRFDSSVVWINKTAVSSISLDPVATD